MASDHPSSSAASSSSSSSAICTRSNKLFWPVVALSFFTVLFFILTIAGYSRSSSSSSPNTTPYPPYSQYSYVGPPLVLPTTPSDTPLTFTILQMNDVYELLPLANGTRGGLARVAYIRSLLQQSDPATLTVFAGDLLSPSALSSAAVNGVQLQGEQMVDTMDVMGLDLFVYGNHEFDLSEPNLQMRLNQANFTWLSYNSYVPDGTRKNLYPNTATNKGYTIRNMNGVRVLFIGLTIDTNMGGTPYVDIANYTDSIKYVKQLIPTLTGQYDVVFGLTHWDLSSDQALVEQVPAVQFVMGGHEHADYYIKRGVGLTPIAKSDSNDATIYIHRFAYYPSTKQIIIQSHLQTVDRSIPELASVANVANRWFKAGMDAFIAQGFEPYAVVIVLPTDFEWDGRSEIVRNSRDNLLTQTVCQSLLFNTTSNSTITNMIALYNTGSVRVDDVLTGELTQYDILRILPFNNSIQSSTVNGSALTQVLLATSNVAGNGGFLQTCGGLSYQSGSGGSGSWQVDGQAIVDTQDYTVMTSNYMTNPRYSQLAYGELGPLGVLMSQQLIAYLQGPTFVMPL